MYDINEKIKLVIWDLDETFWKGTLSEEGIEINVNNIWLVKHLNSRGIINSICSKNDHFIAKEKLEEIGVWDQFVFPKISWSPKGEIIQSLLEEMSLRSENVLFIDDNIMNLEEAKFLMPNINIATPDHLEDIHKSPFLQGKEDSNFSRLNQYKILELKSSEKSEFRSSNYDFLKQSQIVVECLEYASEYFKRIFELVERTNQLNFTQNRPTINELEEQLNQNRNYVVKVRDKYGDYGVVGFISICDAKFEHFLFSCRTMNMGIEGFILKRFSNISTSKFVKKFSSDIENYDYINSHLSENFSNKSIVQKMTGRAILIGSCDLEQTAHYFNDERLLTHFNKVNKHGLDVRWDHTQMIVERLKGLNEEQLASISEMPFMPNLTEDFLDPECKYFILSLLTDYSRGMYRHKSLNYTVAYEHYNNNLIELFDKGLFPPTLNLKKKYFQKLRDNFSYQGVITPEKLVSNIYEILELIGDRKLIVINGAELNNTFENSWENDSFKTHMKLNQAIETINHDRFSIIDVRSFVNSENLLTDNLRHYKKEIYKIIAEEIANRVSDDMTLKRKILSVKKLRMLALKLKEYLKF